MHKSCFFVIALALSFVFAGCNKPDATEPATPPVPVADVSPSPKPVPDFPTPDVPAPKPPAQPAPEVCGDLAPLDPTAHEVFVEDLVDGQDGEYRVVLSQMHAKTEYLKAKKQTRLTYTLQFSKNANLDDPDFKAGIECKYMDEAPEGSISGNAVTPLALSRKDGTLKGRMKAEFEAYGAKSESRDRSDTYYQHDPDYRTLWSLKKALVAAGESRLYQISDGVFELRSKQVSDNGDVRYTITQRLSFIRVK